MLDQAFDELKKYDWGVDPKVLRPIDEAMVKAHDDDAARAKLEEQLAAVLSSDASRSAKDYVCRKLMLIGSAGCVPALASLLGDEELSHMARYALERIPTAEAATALRDALGKLSGELKIGVIGSIGVRGERDSLAVLVKELGSSDASVSRAAALALGAIPGGVSAAALEKFKVPEGEPTIAATDAKLACAEGLLATGKNSEALAVYKSLSGDDQPKHVSLAAKRGVLACLGSKSE
jgi:HEAT repeat protein